MKFVLDVTLDPKANPQLVADRLLDMLFEADDDVLPQGIDSFDGIEVRTD